MIYIFDSSSFIVLGHYFPDQFPSFWDNFNASVVKGDVISVREVLKELDTRSSRAHLQAWVNYHKHIFLLPNSRESAFVAEIFKIPKFCDLISKKQRLQANPVADPFVIASAWFRKGCVVTEESNKSGAARIPNVCDHFSINYMNLEGFMRNKGWKY